MRRNLDAGSPSETQRLPLPADRASRQRAAHQPGSSREGFRAGPARTVRRCPKETGAQLLSGTIQLARPFWRSHWKVSAGVTVATLPTGLIARRVAAGQPAIQPPRTRSQPARPRSVWR